MCTRNDIMAHRKLDLSQNNKSTKFNFHPTYRISPRHFILWLLNNDFPGTSFNIYSTKLQFIT